MVMEFLKNLFNRKNHYTKIFIEDFPEHYHDNAPLPTCGVLGCPEQCIVFHSKKEDCYMMLDRCKKHKSTPLITKLCDHPTCKVGLRDEPYCSAHRFQVSLSFGSESLQRRQ